jgi:putative tricarboxylic transport membrane protein
MNRDQVSSGLFFLLGLFICLHSPTYKLGSLAAPKSGLMPFLCGILMCIIAVTGFVNATLRGHREERRSPLFKGRPWHKSLLTLGALLGFLVLMKPLGFAVVTLLFIGFLLRVIYPQRWSIVVVVTLLTTVFSYVVFEVLLKAQLPKGLWGD